MTHRPERVETELPAGSGEIERMVTLLILLVGLLAALAAFLETRASNQESRADGSAKFALLDRTGAALDIASRGRVDELAHAVAADEGARARAFAAAGGRSRDARAEAQAATRAHTAILTDATLTRDADVGHVWRALSVHDQLAKAYERERDGYTSQARRYITVITDLAVALFLLGLVPTVPAAARRPFLGIAMAISIFAIGWGIYIWTSGPAPPNRRAIEAFATGEAVPTWAGSVPWYSRAIKLDPQFSDAYLGRATARLSLDDYRLAIGDYRRTTQLDSSNFDAWNGLAVGYWWRRDYRSALDAIQHAAELNPGNVTLTFNELEGTFVVFGETPTYRRLRETYILDALRPLGQDGSMELWDDLADFAGSTHNDPHLRPRLQQLCSDLVTAAVGRLGLQRAVDRDSNQSIALASYNCNRLQDPAALAAG
jgi:tetratricopeptide (TPR) repeat protein